MPVLAQSRVGFIGLGYVGLPLASASAEAYSGTSFDIVRELEDCGAAIAAR